MLEIHVRSRVLRRLGFAGEPGAMNPSMFDKQKERDGRLDGLASPSFYGTTEKHRRVRGGGAGLCSHRIRA